MIWKLLIFGLGTIRPQLQLIGTIITTPKLQKKALYWRKSRGWKMKTQRREVRIRCIQCHRPFLISCWYLDHKFERDIIAVNGQWKRGSQYHHFSSSAAPGLLSLGIWSFVIPRGCQQTYSCCFHENAFHELMRSGWRRRHIRDQKPSGMFDHPACLTHTCC